MSGAFLLLSIEQQYLPLLGTTLTAIATEETASTIFKVSREHSQVSSNRTYHRPVRPQRQQQQMNWRIKFFKIETHEEKFDFSSIKIENTETTCLSRQRQSF